MLKRLFMAMMFLVVISLMIFIWIGYKTGTQSEGAFTVWMPTPVVFEEWSAATPEKPDAPAFQGFFLDQQTQRKTWRLGGDKSEMYIEGAENPKKMSLPHSQHFYSRTRPTNTTETHALGAVGKRSHYVALWDLKKRQFVAWLPAGKNEQHYQQRHVLWDRNFENIYWFTQGNQLLQATIDFKSYETTIEIWDTFTDFNYITFGYGEGNFSDDGRRLVLAGEAINKTAIYQRYEVKKRKKYPIRLLHNGTSFTDWIGVDPTGEYIVYAQENPQKTLQIPFLASSDRPALELLDDLKHSDFVIDKQGEPWFSYGNWQGLFAIRVKDGYRKRIWPSLVTDVTTLNCKEVLCETASGHVSRVSGIPGMLLISRNIDGGLYFMNIDQPGVSAYAGNSFQGRAPQASSKNNIELERLGVNEHGEVTEYLREPRGSSSQSGKYVFFTSDYQYYRNRGGYKPDQAGYAFLNMIEVKK
ncbi:MAG: Unknown protein [uncultured Thiotrichaceae bacterium]|uniref:Uncharacterized protein n=1 Tax=uncultured Thiotrichaceae bacterium TaxID=298394 RepID=A0A6S6UGA6_9GAMM|nr:MAG: Unknown protein [uncultured Thiotrichaceae bacterium]